jgi:ATP-dependent DNA ligase
VSRVLVHKAIEPDDLSVKGKKKFDALVADLIDQDAYAIVQPKHDGVYAQFQFDFTLGIWQAWSRTGELYTSVGQDSGIIKSFEQTAINTRAYNGELWLPNTQHSVINGKARKKDPQYLELILFDSFDLTKTPTEDREVYRDRMEYLFSGDGVQPVKNLPVRGKLFSLSDLYDMAREITTRGSSAYDGLMLKDANGLYVPGRGKDGEAIKIKPRKTGDFRVVGTTRGKGNRAGGIGALVVDLGGGIHCEVGTGLSMVDVYDRDFTNKLVEVEYLGVTPKGLLREPSYKLIRNDKTEADVIHPEKTED